MRKRFDIWTWAGFFTAAVLGTLGHFAYDWSGKSLPGGGLLRGERIHMGAHEAAVLPGAAVHGRSALSAVGERLAGRPGSEHHGGPCGDSGAVLYVFRRAGANRGLGEYPHFLCGGRRALWAGQPPAPQRAFPGAVAPDSGALWLWLLAFLFVWWTFRPPHIGLFLDPVTGQYGIA